MIDQHLFDLELDPAWEDLIESVKVVSPEVLLRGVAPRKWMCALDRPIDLVSHMLKKLVSSRFRDAKRFAGPYQLKFPSARPSYFVTHIALKIPQNLTVPLRVIIMVIIRFSRPARIIGRIEKSSRYNDGDTANYDCQGFSLPQPEKPTPEVIYYYHKLTAQNFQIMSIHLGISEHNLMRIPGSLINQGGTTQSHHQDNGTEEIKPYPSIENFPVHVVPGFSR
jgi:hypothetical protein